MSDEKRDFWGGGDYAKVAEIIEPASIALVDACAISAGQEVLDVAAGNGNLALAAARKGAKVVASDLSPGMVALGRARTEAEGVEVEWVEADAEALPFENARFDCAASVFGAIFAPHPEVVAAELFRVVRAGGTVGIASWMAGSLQSGMFALRDKYDPGTPAADAILWGDEEVVRDRLDGLAARIGLEQRTIRFAFESPQAGWEFFHRTSPAQETFHEKLDPAEYEEMGRDFVELLRDLSTATDSSVEIDAPYLLIVARKRG